MNIKSKNILKQIFDNLDQKIIFKMIKYNKSLQKKLTKSLNDYIEENLKIEIELEIIQVENQNITFINFSNSVIASYFHVIFNNNKVEIKKNDKNQLTIQDKVTKIKVLIDKEIESFQGLFENFRYVKKINFIKFNRKNIKNMNAMFCKCSSLKELKSFSF